jgi:hypothetical protein
MALITAQATLYNAFKCRLVDKNISANLTATVTMGHSDPNNVGQFLDQVLPSVTRRVRNQVFRSNSDLTAEGLFGVQNLSAAIVAESSLNLVIPTYVEINWDLLEIPEGKNVTIKLEQGFVIEDLNKFPFALGLPLTADDNLITFRTPKRLNPMQLSSTANSSLVPLRIKPLSAPTFNSISSLSALPIFNPGRLAALFGGNFITTTAPVKTVQLGLHVYADSTLESNSGKLLDPSPTAYFSNFNISLPETFKLRLFESVNNEIISTMPSVDSMRFRGISDNFTSETESAVSAMRFRDPSAAISAVVSMNINPVVIGTLKQTAVYEPSKYNFEGGQSWRKVHVDPLGNLWAISDFRRIWKKPVNSGQFDLIYDTETQGLRTNELVVGSDGAIYFSNTIITSGVQTGGIWRAAPNTTNFVNIAPVSDDTRFASLYILNDGTLYALSPADTTTPIGSLHRRLHRRLSNGSWESLLVTTAASNGQLTFVGSVGYIAGVGQMVRFTHNTSIALSAYTITDNFVGDDFQWGDITTLSNGDLLGYTFPGAPSPMFVWAHAQTSSGFVSSNLWSSYLRSESTILISIAANRITGEIFAINNIGGTNQNDIHCISVIEVDPKINISSTSNLFCFIP